MMAHFFCLPFFFASSYDLEGKGDVLHQRQVDYLNRGGVDIGYAKRWFRLLGLVSAYRWNWAVTWVGVEMLLGQRP